MKFNSRRKVVKFVDFHSESEGSALLMTKKEEEYVQKSRKSAIPEEGFTLREGSSSTMSCSVVSFRDDDTLSTAPSVSLQERKDPNARLKKNVLHPDSIYLCNRRPNNITFKQETKHKVGESTRGPVIIPVKTVSSEDDEADLAKSVYSFKSVDSLIKYSKKKVNKNGNVVSPSEQRQEKDRKCMRPIDERTDYNSEEPSFGLAMKTRNC